MNWLYYLAEANIYLGVFYLAYCLFLTKETYYQLTRAYLLFACVAAFILPVLQIGALKPVEVAITTTVDYALPEYTAQEYAPIVTSPLVIEHHLTVDDYLLYAYFIGAGIVFLMLIVKLFTLFRLLANAKRVVQDKHKLVYLPQTNVAFSFFNYLFIGAEAQGTNTIIRHELVHIRQKHSVDIVFVELIKVVSWFNPFIYLLQNSLKTVHEYIADEQTAAYETDALTYSSFLVNNAYGAGSSSITHSFFNYNLLKKRIVMLNKKRSGNLARLKYLVAVPVCAGLLCVSTLAFSKTYGWVDIDPAKAAKNILSEQPVKIPSSKKPVFPIPSFTSKGYDYLHHQVMKTITYKPAENDKGGFVVVGFDVANNGKLTNIKIEKSGGKEYDAKALNAYKTFNMPINDKSGHRKSVVIYYNGQSTTEIDPIRFAPDCVSSWVISDWEYKVKRTNKGFEYDEYSEYLDNKFNTRVVIYDANGKYVSVSFNKATAAELTLLKNKYGYIFPPLPKGQVKFPPPVIKPKKTGRVKFPPPAVKPDAKAPTEKPDTISRADLTAFYTDLSKRIKYPTTDRDKGIVGRAVVQFYVDNDKTIQYIKVIRSPSDNLSEEIIRVLSSSPYLKAFKGGTWSLPVAFTMDGGFSATQDGKAIVYNPNGFDIPVMVRPTGYLYEVVIRSYPTRSATTQLANNLLKEDLQQFSIYFGQNVHYPAADRQDAIAGRVITVFAVDENGSLQYAKVVRSPSDMMSDEVLRVLKKWPLFSRFKPGVQYTLPISFTIGYEDGPTGITVEPKDRGVGTSKIYNPNSVDIPVSAPGSLILNDVVIRGYIKKQ
jgi:TonB family protein